MEDEGIKFHPVLGVKVFVALLIGLGIGYWIGIKGYLRVEKDAKQSTEEVVDEVAEEVVEETVVPVAVPMSTEEPEDATPARKTKFKFSPKFWAKTGTDPNAITLVSYSHDLLDYNATIAIKNNTESLITSITCRIIYYDMSGNMLDYQDFTKKLKIDSGMIRRFELRGYNYDKYYAYYRSKTASGASNLYKIEFQLRSYTYK